MGTSGTHGEKRRREGKMDARNDENRIIRKGKNTKRREKVDTSVNG